jgi:FG-GAP repeat
MHAKTLASKGISGFCVLALALLLASCKIGRDPSYTVGGTVSGLIGAGLVLQNNGGDNLAISANGAFTFSTPLKKHRSYSVTVLTQPSGQTCTVANGSGSIGGDKVTNVVVTCVSNGFTVGGTVSGLTGTGLVLQNNGGNNLAITADGPFTFPPLLAGGASYIVTVLTQPSGQGCSVANGSGNIAGANVTNVWVACAAPPAAPILSLGFGVKELQFTWPAVGGADFYRLLENPDGVSGYSQVATNIAALSYNHTIPVHRRLNASYIVEACNVGGCTPSFAQTLGINSLTQAIGYFKASNTGVGDQFGLSVALSGDGNTLAVGAPNEDSSSTGINSTPNESAANAGAVYVFTKSAGTWLQQAYVKASNAGANASFGISVALSGDGNTLAVGARSEASSTTGINSTPDQSAPSAGAVYVFTRTTGTWSQQAYVKASNTESGDFFGSVVALSGDGNTLAVGAVFESSALTGVTAGIVDEATAGNAASFAGAVYVYARAAGSWSQQAYVKASNTESADLFGNSLALSGDGNTLAVGAPLEGSSLTGVTPGSVNEATSGNAALASGAVYVYARIAGTWSQQAYVKASNTGAGDNFGNSVALSGDGNALAVGAPFEDSSSTGINSTPDELATDAGAAYVYSRSAGTWSQQAYVKASNAGAGDNFGTSIAVSGDGNALAVGAPLEDGGGIGIGSTPDELATDAGAAYFYTRSTGTWSQQTYVKASNPDPLDNFGTSVALNSDGNTLAVGAQLEDGSSTGIDGTPDNSAANAGAVYLY